MSTNCPKCNVATKPFTLDADLTFDKCEKCKGMWMDKGELGRTAGHLQDFIDPVAAMNGPQTNFNCPKCANSKLHEILYAPKTKLILDVCKTCQGLWLDSRELIQIQKILHDHRIEQKKKKHA